MDTTHFRDSARRWIHAALDAFSNGSHAFAVHHAGVAAEHLLKAYLASLHPALIVEGKDFDALLHATGHGAQASIPLSRIKTIGLAEAHFRAYKLLRGRLLVGQRDLIPLANARNGVAHSGIHDFTEVRTVITTCLRLIDALLHELEIHPGGFWGRFTELHNNLMDEQAKEARIELESALAKARANFERSFGHLRSKHRARVLATITRRPPGYLEHDVPADCPACGSQGWLGGDIHVDASDPAFPSVVFVPYLFDCLACGLDIEGEPFRELSDLSAEIDLEKRPEDFYHSGKELGIPESVLGPTEADLFNSSATRPR
ncbi:HEPN domain-containing protein [Streptomyces asiaticus]